LADVPVLLLAGVLPALQSAGIAVLVAAVSGYPVFQGVAIFLLEEGFPYADINVCPGQGLIQGALPLGIESGIKPGFGKGTEPVLVVEVFTPAVKD